MTWVRFSMTVESLATIIRCEARAPRPAEEEFRDHREGDDHALPGDN